MKKGIIGKKIGMTQVFDEKGNVIPVTLIEAGPCYVTQIKTIEKDGYEAVQLGFVTAKETAVNKPTKGHFSKHGIPAQRHLNEFRLEDISGYKEGDTVTADIFSVGEKVDISGVTKGRGYSGVVKRWNAHILRMTHGTCPIHRQPGSKVVIDPARIFKNKKMAGQYGNENVTVLNLEVVKINTELNILAVKGAVPGARGGIVFIRNTAKVK